MKSQLPQTRKVLYESLFDNMLDGLAYRQMIFDAQRHPIDFQNITRKQLEKNLKSVAGEPRSTNIVDKQ